MFNEQALKLVNEAEKECEGIFSKIEEIGLYNQKKVLDAFRDAGLALADIASSTGYGNEDRARGKLAEIYAKAFGGETGIVSPLITSGTHGLAIALFGLLRPNDLMLCITGTPYDSLTDVIFTKGAGSLADFNVKFDQVELKDNDFDDEEVVKKVSELKPKMVYIQKSRGYSTRNSLSIYQIERIIKKVRQAYKDTIVFVDNNYGEYTEMLEPCNVGADVMVGSLIKNAGGGIAPTGAYIVGTEKAINQISSRFLAPGIGLELGSYAGNYTPFFQGAFAAPHVVMNIMKGNILFGMVAKKLGIDSLPKLDEMPRDIVRTIEFGDPDKLVEFCRLIQKLSPVDSFVVPYPWEMAGYHDKIVMASGSFIQGSTIELSADAPIRPPYIAYLQGGLNFEHIKIACIEFAEIYMNK